MKSSLFVIAALFSSASAYERFVAAEEVTLQVEAEAEARTNVRQLLRQ
jgi:hypothetical protein